MQDQSLQAHSKANAKILDKTDMQPTASWQQRAMPNNLTPDYQQPMAMQLTNEQPEEGQIRNKVDQGWYGNHAHLKLHTYVFIHKYI